MRDENFTKNKRANALFRIRPFTFLKRVFLFSVAYSPRFAYYGNFHLSGIGHFILNFLGDVKRKEFGFFVVEFVGANDDAEFATGLYADVSRCRIAIGG